MERAGPAQRVEPGAPERLVRVDVADPGDEGLVEQERLESPAAAAKPPPEGPQREGGVERLGSVPGEQRAAVLRVQDRAASRVPRPEPYPAELADVAEAELAAVVQREAQVDVPVGRGAGRHHEELAGHLEVDRQRGTARQVHDDQLRAPADRVDAAPGHGAGERGDRGVRGDRARPVARGTGDRGAHDEPPQVARDRLHLGKLGHRRVRLPRRAGRRSSTPSRRRS